MSVIDLSIIIVLYKSKDVIRKCLESIERFNDIGLSLEVTLVDNTPIDDGTFELIDNDFKWARYIKNRENGGFGQGNNVGARHSSGRYLLFLNPDTYLVEPIFKYAIEQFDADPDLKAFGMTLLTGDGKYAKSFGIMPEKKGLIPVKFYELLVRYLNIIPSSIFPWGADLFVRKEQFDQAGGFDENIFLCYEEPDLMRRMSGGWAGVFDKKIVHIDGHTTVDDSVRLTRSLVSERYYFEKYKLNYKRYARRALTTKRFALFIKGLLKRRTEEDRYLVNYYSSVIAAL